MKDEFNWLKRDFETNETMDEIHLFNELQAVISSRDLNDTELYEVSLENGGRSIYIRTNQSSAKFLELEKTEFEYSDEPNYERVLNYLNPIHMS